MKKSLTIFPVVFSTILSGCSGTPYIEKGSSMYAGGYSDEKIGNNKYLVRFEGTGYNKMPQVVGFVKRRAAEICAPLEAEVEIKEYISEDTKYALYNGQAHVTKHEFPNAEGIVSCISKT